jgi:hypothetical protein
MTDLIKYIEEARKLAEDGKNKGQIEGYMKFQHDLSTAEAKEVVAEALPDTARGSADWTATVEFLRENREKLNKHDLIEGMCEVNGKTFNTNQHAYNYIAMAIEWASQELEAQGS